MSGQIQTRRPGGLPQSQWRSDPLTALRNEMNDLRSRFWGDDEGWFAGTMEMIQAPAAQPGTSPMNMGTRLSRSMAPRS